MAGDAVLTAAVSTNPNDLTQADSYLSQLVTWGVVLTFVGGVIIILGWPHTTIESSVPSGPDAVERGHRCYEQSNPFLSHSDPAVTGTTQAMREPHPQAGSR